MPEPGTGRRAVAGGGQRLEVRQLPPDLGAPVEDRGPDVVLVVGRHRVLAVAVAVAFAVAVAIAGAGVGTGVGIGRHVSFSP